jgi:hypothetical protein
MVICPTVGIRGEIEIGQLALKSWAWAYFFTEAIVLIKIHKMKDVFWNCTRLCGIESHDEFDRHMRFVKLVGDLQRRIGSQRMADKDHDIFLAARILVGDAPRHGLPNTGAVNASAIPVPIELIGKGVHATRKYVRETPKQIDAHLRRRRRRLRVDLSGARQQYCNAEPCNYA